MLWKQKQKRAFPEPKTHLLDSSGDGSLNPHSSGESPRSPSGLVNGGNSLRPWTIHCAFIEDPLPTLDPRDEQDILAIPLLSPVRETHIEILQ